MDFLKRQRGAAMVELAIITPLMVILLFGFIEVGRALIQTNSLTKAVNTGARYLAREPDAVTKDVHCNAGPAWAAATTEAGSLVAYDDDGNLILPGLDAGGAVVFSRRVYTAGPITACVVKVVAQAQFAAIFGDSIVPFLSLGPIQLNATAEERYIGE